MKQIKDFIADNISKSLLDMDEFFIENPNLRMIEHEPIDSGIRVYYIEQLSEIDDLTYDELKNLYQHLLAEIEILRSENERLKKIDNS